MDNTEAKGSQTTDATSAQETSTAEVDALATEIAFARSALTKKSTPGKGDVGRIAAAIGQGLASDAHWSEALDLLTKVPDLVPDIWNTLSEEQRSQRRAQIIDHAPTARDEVNIARAACFRGVDDEITESLLRAGLAKWPAAGSQKGKDRVLLALDAYFLGEEKWRELPLTSSDSRTIVSKLAMALMHSPRFQQDNRPKFLCEFAEWVGAILVQTNAPVDERRAIVTPLITLPRYFDDRFKARVLVAAGLQTAPATSAPPARESGSPTPNERPPDGVRAAQQSLSPAAQSESAIADSPAVDSVADISSAASLSADSAAEDADVHPDLDATMSASAVLDSETQVQDEEIPEAAARTTAKPSPKTRSPRPHVAQREARGHAPTVREPDASSSGSTRRSEGGSPSPIVARAREVAAAIESEIEKRRVELDTVRTLADNLERAHEAERTAVEEAGNLRDELDLTRGKLESRTEELHETSVRLAERTVELEKLGEEITNRDREASELKDQLRGTAEQHAHQLDNQLEIRVKELKGRMKDRLAHVFANLREVDTSAVDQETIDFLRGRIRELEELLHELGVEV